MNSDSAPTGAAQTTGNDPERDAMVAALAEAGLENEIHLFDEFRDTPVDDDMQDIPWDEHVETEGAYFG